MIMVHRLKGEPMLLNADLITTIESNPDTVITLADGRRLVVSDFAEDIVDHAKTPATRESPIGKGCAKVVVAFKSPRKLMEFISDGFECSLGAGNSSNCAGVAVDSFGHRCVFP